MSKSSTKQSKKVADATSKSPTDLEQDVPEKIEPMIDSEHTEAPNNDLSEASEGKRDEVIKDSEIEAMEQNYAQLEAKLTAMTEQFMRARADVENTRKRADSEITNVRRFAIEGFAKELLAVVDSLELAQNAAATENTDALIQIREGIDLTLRQLHATFAKYSLTVIEPEVGERLDPAIHQAISLVEAQDVETDCIVTMVQKGYRINTRLLRPANVVVAK